MGYAVAYSVTSHNGPSLFYRRTRDPFININKLQFLDEMLSGVKRHYGQETLSLITATGLLLRLNLDSNHISILQEKFSLDLSSFELNFT